MSVNTSRLLVVVWFLTSLVITHLMPSRIVNNHFYNSNILLTLLSFSTIVLVQYLLATIRPTHKKKVVQEVRFLPLDDSQKSKGKSCSRSFERTRVRSGSE